MRDRGDGESRFRPFRRGVLRLLGVLGVTGVLAGRGTAATGNGVGIETASSVSELRRRVKRELTTRMRYSRTQLKREGEMAAHESNDRISTEAVVSKFGKSLQHDDDTGLPTAEAYASLVRACETGEGFDDIEQQSLDLDADEGIVDEIEPSDFVDEEGSLSPKPLVQPESAWSYMTEGKSTAQLEIAVPPAFDSAETGAEMVELYWRALTRDIPFNEYEIDEHEEIADAVTELNDIEGYRGPGSEADPNSDTLDGGNLFRGVTPGAQTGPYVSQFLWKDIALGARTEEQKLEPQIAETTPRDYMTDVEHWLKVQKGVVPSVDDNLPGNEYADEPRYIITGRDMCERVHDDPPFRQVQT
ncbi:MAG: hypothetical protein ABEJ34_07125, partial [Haloferacaceae archaeon]